MKVIKVKLSTDTLICTSTPTSCKIDWLDENGRSMAIISLSDFSLVKRMLPLVAAEGIPVPKENIAEQEANYNTMMAMWPEYYDALPVYKEYSFIEFVFEMKQHMDKIKAKSALAA